MKDGIKIFSLRLLRKLKVLKYLDLKLKLTLNQNEFEVPIIHEIGFNNHCMDEFWMLDLFKSWDIQEHDVLLDIGANVGQTMLKWKAANRGATYIGVEPLPACAEYLYQLSERNQFVNVHILNAAVYDQSGSFKLHLQFDEPTDRTASLISTPDSIQAIDVDTLTFDQLMNMLDVVPEKFKIIKIDAEGAELNILESMSSYLTDHNPIIIMEVLAGTGLKAESKLKRLLSLIDRLNYVPYRVKKSGNNLDRLERIDTIDPGTSVYDSDYVLVKNS